MANAAISYLNLADSGTLTASTAEPLAPITNLQQSHPSRQWVGADVSSDYFVLDLGALRIIDSLALINVTASTARVRISSVDATGAAGDLYDSGATAFDQNYGDVVTALGSPVNGRYVRYDLAGSSAVAAGRLFVGLRTAFGVNFNFGWQRLWTDPSIKTKTTGGQTQVFEKEPYRSVELTFGFLSETERNGIVESIDRVCGARRDVLFMSDPASTNLARDTYFGLITDTTPVIQPYFDLWAKQYRIEERL